MIQGVQELLPDRTIQLYALIAGLLFLWFVFIIIAVLIDKKRKKNI